MRILAVEEFHAEKNTEKSFTQRYAEDRRVTQRRPQKNAEKGFTRSYAERTGIRLGRTVVPSSCLLCVTLRSSAYLCVKSGLSVAGCGSAAFGSGRE